MAFGGAFHKYNAKPVILCPSCGYQWQPAMKDRKRCISCGYEKCIRFASTREMNRYHELRLMEGAGHISDLQLQPKFPFPMGFSYIGDFAYSEAGSAIVEDAKGFETAEFKLKRKCFEYFFPEVELRITK